MNSLVNLNTNWITGINVLTTFVALEIWNTWWRHQMETFSALLAICAGNSPVPGEFPTQRPVTRSFDVYFDLRPNKWLSKQSWGWWFETLSCSLWRHRYGHHRKGRGLGKEGSGSSHEPVLYLYMKASYITMTSQWARWRLKSPALGLFTELFIQMQIKENTKAPRHWPLCGEFTGTGEFPAQKASNAENVSIWWRHHDIYSYGCYF